MPKLLVSCTLALAACASSVQAQDWTQLADMPGPARHHPVNFVLGGYGYAATGTTTSAGTSDDFYRYDPSTNAWEILPDFPGPDRSYAYGGTYNGKGYLGFGIAGIYLNDLWEFDPEDGQWTQLASLPGAGRTHPAFIITDDGKIYVGTGGGAGGNLRDWWEYDIATNQWTRRADLPGPSRHHPFYFNIGNVPYVGFGHGAAIYNDFYRFDPVTLTWTQMNAFPGEGRVAGTQFSFGGKGYVLSGQGEDHDYLPTGEFWEYDPVSDSWVQLPAHPGSGRWAPGSFLIDDVIYLMAGTSTTGQKRDLWKFDLGDVTGVPTQELTQLSLTLYPNPVMGDQIRLLNVPAGFERASIDLVAPDGRRLFQMDRGDEVLELPSGLASGTYFVTFAAPNGASATRQITIIR